MIYQKFFGLTFEKITIDGLWHEDVQALSVSKDGILRGYILLDLFPRENKYNHVAELNIVNAIRRSGKLHPAVTIVMANFPRPTENKPALFLRNDVIIFFHEFGHALHDILGATELFMNSGTEVKQDFVELPSQMLEEWMWQPQFLKLISKHYITGQPLSDELIEKILSHRNYASGSYTLEQIFYASVSLELFKAGAHKDIHALVHKLFDQFYTNVAYQDDVHFYANFNHLTNYGAKYYGYLWSKVYALDVFDSIKRHDFSPEIGQKYSDTILSKGGADDPMHLLHNFLGREPHADAFFKVLEL